MRQHPTHRKLRRGSRKTSRADASPETSPAAGYSSAREQTTLETAADQGSAGSNSAEVSRPAHAQPAAAKPADANADSRAKTEAAAGSVHSVPMSETAPKDRDNFTIAVPSRAAPSPAKSVESATKVESSMATTFNASFDVNRLSGLPTGAKEAMEAERKPAAANSTAIGTTTVTAASTPTSEEGAKTFAKQLERSQRSQEAAPAATPAISAAPSPSAPAEPEQHDDGDAVESTIRKMKGTRPDLLRTSTYYAGAKHVYITLAGLPVLSALAPQVESLTESLINMTPLKPSPEEAAEQKSVEVLDKRICNALSFADEVVDSKKDEAIEGIVSVKKAIHTFGPVHSAVGIACDAGDGVGKAYGSATDTVGGIWHQVFWHVSNTYHSATSMAGDAVGNVTNTAGNAVNHVKATTCNVVDCAKGTAGHTVGGVKSVVGTTADSIGSTANWATSTAVSLIKKAVSIPMSILHSVLGKNDKGPEPGPEE